MPKEYQPTRRDFLYAAVLAGLSLSGCLPSETPTPTKEPTKPPTPTNTDTPNTATPTTEATIAIKPTRIPKVEATISPELIARYRLRYDQAVEYFQAGHSISYMAKVLNHPEFQYSHDESKIDATASAIKFPLAIFAAFRFPKELGAQTDPELFRSKYDMSSLTPFQKSLRQMLVNSHNTETGLVLQKVALTDNPLDDFNSFLHTYFGFPLNEGMSNWPPLPSTTQPLLRPGFDNPVTMKTFIEFVSRLEDKETLKQIVAAAHKQYGQDLSFDEYNNNLTLAIANIKFILSLPSDLQENGVDKAATPADKALERAIIKYPDVQFYLYNKDGNLRDVDWGQRRQLNNEIAVINAFRNKKVVTTAIAYTTSSFQLEELLDTTFDLTADLVKLP